MIDAMTNGPIVADRMNSLSRMVFFQMMDKEEWHKYELVKNDIEEQIQKMNNQSGTGKRGSKYSPRN